ncbi:hypothetical protein LXL04_007165 [Taraxacum kok-saghyz]
MCACNLQSQHQRNYLKSDCEGGGRARFVAGEGAVAGGCSIVIGIDFQEAEARVDLQEAEAGVDLQEAVVDLRGSPASPCTKNHASSYKCFMASLPGTHSFTKNRVKVDTAAYMKKVPHVIQIESKALLTFKKKLIETRRLLAAIRTADNCNINWKSGRNYGEPKLNGAQSDDENAEENGDGFTKDLSGRGKHARLPGAHTSHTVPTSGMEERLLEAAASAPVLDLRIS